MGRVIELELETDENGELHLTKEQLGSIGAHQDVKVRLEPQASKPAWGPRWANMTPEERAKDFEVWVKQFRDDDAPALSDCRLAFHKPLAQNSEGHVVISNKRYPCPKCGQLMTPMGKNFRAPQKSDEEAWKVAEVLAENGFIHNATQGYFYPTKLRGVPKFLKEHRQQSEGAKLLEKFDNQE